MSKKLFHIKNKLSHCLIRNSFPQKLTFAFLTATIVPLFLISVIFYRINTQNSYDKVMNATSLTNRQLVDQIESRFTQMNQVAATLRSYMYTYPEKNGSISTEQLQTFYTLRTNIQTLVSAFDFGYICIFLDSDYIFTNEGLMFYSLDSLSDFGLSAQELLESNTDSVWLFVENQSYPFMLNKKYTSFNAINCVHMLRDGLDGTLRYVFFISINADEFTELLTAFYADSGITGYLLDNNSQLVAFSGTEETKTLVCDLFSDKPELLAADFSNQPDALYYINALSNGWTYVTRVSQDYLRASASAYVGSFLLILALIVPCMVVFIIFLANNFTKRITLLSNSAKQVNFSENQFHGSFIEYVKDKPEKNYDEVDKLAVTYNRMMQTLQENIDSITALRAQEESLKYQLLQSLINPHFLYNILDSIMVCNNMGKPELANKLIMNLTRFYRMTLRKSNELITIRDELEIAQLYMELESICRGGNFTWSIETDEAIENFMICKFTLQPFIENSIHHGMQGSSQKLHIQIEIRYGDDTILIFIRDNGNGISPDRLEELRESLRTRIVDTSRHFGICNVNARISSELFGHGFIEIDSEYKAGTTVKIEFQQILP